MEDKLVVKNPVHGKYLRLRHNRAMTIASDTIGAKAIAQVMALEAENSYANGNDYSFTKDFSIKKSGEQLYQEMLEKFESGILLKVFEQEFNSIDPDFSVEIKLGGGGVDCEQGTPLPSYLEIFCHIDEQCIAE